MAGMGDFEWDEVTDTPIYRSDVIFGIYGLTRAEARETVEETNQPIHPPRRP